MFRVEVTSTDPDFEERHIRFIRNAPRVMKKRLDAAALEERRTHEYKNRTHDLENSTQAGEIIDVGNQKVVQLTMGMPYASYVNNRGLSRIDEIAKEAETETEYLLDSGPDGS